MVPLYSVNPHPGDKDEKDEKKKDADENKPPPLVSLDDKKAMVGRKVLTAQLEDDACGWYMGTVVSSAVGKAWKKILPTATHIIEYKQKETRTTKLVGKAAYGMSSPQRSTAPWSGGCCWSRRSEAAAARFVQGAGGRTHV